MSLVHEIKSYLKDRPYEWIHKGELERLAFEWGREVSNVDRRCREMTQYKHPSYWIAIEKGEDIKGRRMYRYNPDKDPLAVKRPTPERQLSMI